MAHGNLSHPVGSGINANIHGLEILRATLSPLSTLCFISVGYFGLKLQYSEICGRVGSTSLHVLTALKSIEDRKHDYSCLRRGISS